MIQSEPPRHKEFQLSVQKETTMITHSGIFWSFMWIKMDQEHTKGHEHQISEAEHQESKNSTGMQIVKHRPIRYDRNQLFVINHDTHKTELDGDTVINERRPRIKKKKKKT